MFLPSTKLYAPGSDLQVNCALPGHSKCEPTAQGSFSYDYSNLVRHAGARACANRHSGTSLQCLQAICPMQVSHKNRFSSGVLCRGSRVRKTSRRDLPAVMAAGADGATTVSATMLLAAHAGITVFVTGGEQANPSGAKRAAQSQSTCVRQRLQLPDTTSFIAVCSFDAA